MPKQQWSYAPWKPVKKVDRTKAERAKVRSAFDRDALKRVCEMHEDDFGEAFGLEKIAVEQRAPADFYYFRDNGSNILAVAHLDTVVAHAQRACGFLDTADGPVVYSGGLDDRLGAYIILELLPALGITYDWLLTTGEESGASTAQFFDPPKVYDWIIEFDRGGTDVVMYDFEDDDTVWRVEDSGARVGSGSFTDICWLEHLRVKGFNWGVGYQDYHGPRSHAYLNDTFEMLGYYLKFHEANAEEYIPHTPRWGAEEEADAWWEEEEEREREEAEHGTYSGDEYAFIADYLKRKHGVVTKVEQL